MSSKTQKRRLTEFFAVKTDDRPEKKKRSDETNPAARVSLTELLDFTSLNTDCDIQTRFTQLARSLLQDHRLTLNAEGRTTEYEILELEFYLRKEGCHMDPFTHASEEQRVAGKWYFHRAPMYSADSHKSLTSTAQYRGGTRKGLDLTMGGPVPSPHFPPTADVSTSSAAVRGGILLRSLRRVTDDKVISGPSLIVDEILRASCAKEITELVDDKWGHDTSAFAYPSSARTASLCVKAVEHPTSVEPTIYRSPRIGLDLSHPGTTPSTSHPRVMYLTRLYRYFTNPTLLTANGRVQTFLGIYYSLVEAKKFGDDETGCANLSRVMGAKRSVVEKYLSEFRHGKANGELKAFVGNAGKGASASPAIYLRMMGTLSQ